MTYDQRPAPVPTDPAYAAAIGLVRAPFGPRVLAAVLDGLLVAIVTLPLLLGALPVLLRAALGVAGGGDPAALVRSGDLTSGLIWYAVGQGGLLVLVVVQLILHGTRGVTVGKAICGLRSISVRTFGRPGVGRVLLRGLVLWAAAGIVPIVGAVPFLLSPLWDQQHRGRGWLDRISATWLVDVRRGLDPRDAKALRLARKRLDAPQPEPDAPLPSLSTASSGSFAAYLPATRSSSGVVSAAPDAPAWTPPVVGAPAGAAPPGRAPEPPAVLAVLVFDDGSRISISGPRILGRHPLSTDEAEALAIDDPSMQLSKTHAVIGVDANGLWVEDRQSANGTALLAEDGSERPLEPGVRHRVPWASSLALGGRRIRVDPPPGDGYERQGSVLEGTGRA